MAGYVRQSVADIQNGEEVLATPLNNEFNALRDAFNGATGHEHDGSTGNGPKIDLTTSVSGVLPVANGGSGLSSLDTFTLTSTDAGATAAPTLNLYRNSATPAAADLGGVINFQFEDSAGNTDTLASVTARADNVTSTTEAGSLIFSVATAGALANELILNSTALVPATSDGLALGSTTLQFSDIFIAEGGVINWDNGDATLTQTNNTLAFGGIDTITFPASLALSWDSADVVLTHSSNMLTVTGGDFTAPNLIAGTAFLPDANDGATLGTTALQFSDLFLAEGGVINWDNGDATLTQTGNTVALAGADFQTPNLLIPSTGTLNFNAGDVVLTHSANLLALTGGDLQVPNLLIPSAGTINFNSSDVVLTHSADMLTLSGGDLTLVSTDASAAAGPSLYLYRNSASPNTNDFLGQLVFQGEDSAGNTEDFAIIDVQAENVSNGTENARVRIRSKVNGTMTTLAQFGLTSGTGTNWEVIRALDVTTNLQVTDLSFYQTIRISGHLTPATDGVSLMLRTDTNNGASFDAGASDYAWQTVVTNGATTTGVENTGDTEIQISGSTSAGNATGEGISFNLLLSNFNQSDYMFLTGTFNVVNPSGAMHAGTISARRLNNTPRDAFLMFFSSGNATGQVVVEGMRG